MSTADKQIADILAKYGEPMAGNIWRVQGQAVIYHKALERIAAQAQIHFDTPMLLRTERDEAVLLVTGRMDGRVEWSIGEALVPTAPGPVTTASQASRRRSSTPWPRSAPRTA